MSIEKYDICILGGGMAGMTAAVYAARANRKTLLLEAAITGGLANSTYIVENFPSHKNIHGMKLMQDVRSQVDALGVTVEEIVEVEKLELEKNPKRIVTPEAVYEAPAVIVATGRKPIPLDVPAECGQVHHCAICDGAPYKGKRVLVVGGGNSAFDEALFLLQLGVAQITIIEVMDRFFAAQSAQDAFFAHDCADGHHSTRVVDLLLQGDRLSEAVLETTGKGRWNLPVDGVFVFMGQNPNSEMLNGILELDDKGYVKAGPSMETNIPGVFSAGDINAKQFRQLTTAAADGTIAALTADQYLRKAST